MKQIEQVIYNLKSYFVASQSSLLVSYTDAPAYDWTDKV